MRFSAGKKYLQNLYLQINRRSDKLIGVILLAISLLSYAMWSIHSWDNVFYLATLCYYIIITFFIVKVPVFSAVGMYNLYLFGYVQIGVLMQGLYTQFEPTVIYTIAFYNVTAPFLLLIWKRRKNTQNAFALKRVYISPKLSACLFYLGVACILAFFVWVGTIPMLAEDAAPNRLERAKQMLSKMIDNMVDDKVGLVVFAGDAFTQLPITCDYVSAKMFLHTITPNLIPTQGTAIGAALQTAITSFGAQESDAGRAIILITDGENHEDDAVAAAKKAHELGVQVFVIGIGKPEGAPIPKPGTNDYFKDRSGQVVVSRLNEEMCTEIALAGNGMYVRCDNTNTAMRALQQELDRIATAELESTVYADFNEQYQSFLLIALLLLVIEVFILSRKNHRLTRMDLFRENNKKN